MSNENMVHVGIYFPKETLKKIDERKGKYYSRNKYFLKIVDEYLNDNELKNLQGSEVSAPVTHAAPTPTTPHLITSDVSGRMMKTTIDDEGSEDREVIERQ